jgi:hypothetical protein
MGRLHLEVLSFRWKGSVEPGYGLVVHCGLWQEAHSCGSAKLKDRF